ncbi:solute carrier family 52, riboflavin transporter, member 3-A-like [Hetaerina americana]|uniref:solute carrier family 52, riboflavin transporter, member 3-A-like n=1 Tax=Hetaerina americana TaxID=62018 RepID=UPI003A7F2DB0
MINMVNSEQCDQNIYSEEEYRKTSLEPKYVEFRHSRTPNFPSEADEINEVEHILPQHNDLLLKKKMVKILLIQGWICFFSSGFLPGVSTYASLPHGNEAFHLSSTLGAAVVPIGTAIAFIHKRHSKLSVIGIIAAFASILSVYTILSAAYSPNPPLVGSETGKVLIVLNIVLYAGLSAYVKVNSAQICRHIEGSLSKGRGTVEGNGRGPLFWCGAVSQAAAGSLLDLTLVTILGLFKSS